MEKEQHHQQQQHQHHQLNQQQKSSKTFREIYRPPSMRKEDEFEVQHQEKQQTVNLNLNEKLQHQHQQQYNNNPGGGGGRRNSRRGRNSAGKCNSNAINNGVADEYSDRPNMQNYASRSKKTSGYGFSSSSTSNSSSLKRDSHSYANFNNNNKNCPLQNIPVPCSPSSSGGHNSYNIIKQNISSDTSALPNNGVRRNKSLGAMNVRFAEDYIASTSGSGLSGVHSVINSHSQNMQKYNVQKLQKRDDQYNNDKGKINKVLGSKDDNGNDNNRMENKAISDPSENGIKSGGNKVTRSKSFTEGISRNKSRALFANNLQFWSKNVQEAILKALNSQVWMAPSGGSKFLIDMVSLIFENMMNKVHPEGSANAATAVAANGEDSNQQINSGVHIFLYFIQREKGRTVLESLLNNCLAYQQDLVEQGKRNKEHSSKSSISESDFDSTKLNNFLKFLSAFYTQLKMLKRNINDQMKLKIRLEELSLKILSILSDSTLYTIRNQLHTISTSTRRYFINSKYLRYYGHAVTLLSSSCKFSLNYACTLIMDILFNIMIGIGRDLEYNYPLKMKQNLAAVRDILLGVIPNFPELTGNENEVYLALFKRTRDYIQKTLMQIIELNAASWQMNCSALRYYYK